MIVASMIFYIKNELFLLLDIECDSVKVHV